MKLLVARGGCQVIRTVAGAGGTRYVLHRYGTGLPD
jgi:hypothetical protein